MPDYTERIRALRALGAPNSGATEHERALANKRADELEAKYGNVKSPSTDDTTVTGRDGRFFVYTTPGFKPPPPNPFVDQMLRDLFNNQWQWNSRYYDKDGNPKPGYGGPDEDTMYEEAYKYEEHDYERYNNDE